MSKFFKPKNLINILIIIIFVFGFFMPRVGWGKVYCCYLQYRNQKLFTTLLLQQKDGEICQSKKGFQNYIHFNSYKDNFTCNKFELDKTWCCVEDKKGIYIVIKEQSKCPKDGKFTLLKSPCHYLTHSRSSLLMTSSRYTATKGKGSNSISDEQIAQGIIMPKLSIPLPGLTQFAQPTISKDQAGNRFLSIPWIAQWVSWFYSYAIAISGTIAIIIIMVAGFLWITSAGDPSKINQAKDLIKSAVLGLTLIFVAYILLYYINPSLTKPANIKIQLPSDKGQEKVAKKCAITFKGQKIFTINGKNYCVNFADSKNYVSLYKQAKNLKHITFIKKGIEYDYVHKNLYNALVKLNNLLEKQKKYNDIKLEIHSISRSLSTQARLCNCYYNKKNTGKCEKGCGACNLAAAPNCQKGSNHLKGRALDVSLIGKYNGKSLNCGLLKQIYNCHIPKYSGNTFCDQTLLNHTTVEECQTLLRKLMLQVGFTGIDIEWWHFNYLTKSQSSTKSQKKK